MDCRDNKMLFRTILKKIILMLLLNRHVDSDDNDLRQISMYIQGMGG